MEKCLSKSLLVVLTIFIFTIVITYNNNAGDLKGDVFKTESTNDDAETAKLIQDRVMRLEEWCSGKTEVKFIDFRSARDNLVSYDWMYVPEYRLFYCSIPKVASTTLKKRLMEVIGVTVANDTTEIHQQAVKYLSLNDWNNKTSMSDVPLARSRRNPFAPPVSRNRSLIVVRNPYERLVSAFQDKIVNAGGEWTHLRQYCYNYEPAMATTSTNNQVFAVTFSEFVNCVLSNHHSKQPFYNDHVCPMSKICATCLIRYDLIIKKENFSAEMGYALSQVHGDTKALRKLLNKSRLNPTQPKNSLPSHYVSMYRQLSDRQLTQLQLMYHDDFEIFGYDKKIV